MRSGPGFISIKGVDLSYGRKDSIRALQGLELTVDRSSFVAVVGPSGCGKSSLMKLVSGLRAPDAGTISIDGVDIDGPLEIAGMAFQNPTLLPWRNILSNILLPFEIVDEHRYRIRVRRDAYADKARALLRAVGLEDVESRFPWQLSGGMQQRISLCRALVHNPALLLLDEPFGALDAFTREELWDVLQDLWIDRQFTAILVTHDLREAVYLADKVYVMSRRPGRVVAALDIPIARPRTTETTFEPDFIALVHRLRDHIGVQMRRESCSAANGTVS